MGLLATLLTGGRPGHSRILPWLACLAWAFLRRPVRTSRLLNPFRFARETVIFLCMQTVDGHIDMRLRRRWFWPFRKILCSEGKKIAAFIPQANEFARKAAAVMGGTAMSTVMEILLSVPTTAHVLGGCVMADSSEDGVVDSRNRVFGYQNMYICGRLGPGGGTLGVNPSLAHYMCRYRAGHEFRAGGPLRQSFRGVRGSALNRLSRVVLCRPARDNGADGVCGVLKASGPISRQRCPTVAQRHTLLPPDCSRFTHQPEAGLPCFNLPGNARY